MSKIFVSIYLFIVFLQIPSAFSKNILDQLSPHELKLFKQDKFILKTSEINNFAWPEVTIYAVINATPIESIAIFAAYDDQKNYVPNLLKSNPISKSPTIVEVEYISALPWPLQNAKYTNSHKLTKKNNYYKLEWTMVSSNTAKSVKGHAEFFPYAGNTTLLKYVNLVGPDSIFARLLKKTMLSDVSKSIATIIIHIENVRNNKKEIILKYIDKINKALSGEHVYPQKAL